jgi:hypothetical protein
MGNAMSCWRTRQACSARSDASSAAVYHPSQHQLAGLALNMFDEVLAAVNDVTTLAG